jgi:hypothetical protein
MSNKKPKSLNDLTIEQRKKLLFKKCATREELSNFIQLFFGFHLPDCIVSRYSDTSPLDVVWEVYDICANKNNPADIDELLYVAGRGSGKTLGMAIAEIMVVLHDQRDVCHVGAVMAQAKRCYEYQTKFLMSPKIRPIIEDKKVPLEDRVLQKMNMEKSIFKINDIMTSIEVLPCTLSACLTKDALVNQYIDGVKSTVEVGSLNKGDLVCTANNQLTKVISNKIDHEECMRIELDDGRVIEGTLNHKVMTKNGWVELQNLTDQDDII